MADKTKVSYDSHIRDTDANLVSLSVHSRVELPWRGIDLTRSYSFPPVGRSELGGSVQGWMSDLSSVTEVILFACIVRTSPHFGHDAICIAGNGSEFTLATTFTRVPHLQRHIDTFATIRASRCFVHLRRRILRKTLMEPKEN